MEKYVKILENINEHNEKSKINFKKNLKGCDKYKILNKCLEEKIYNAENNFKKIENKNEVENMKRISYNLERIPNYKNKSGNLEKEFDFNEKINISRNSNFNNSNDGLDIFQKINSIQKCFKDKIIENSSKFSNDILDKTNYTYKNLKYQCKTMSFNFFYLFLT